MEQVLFWNAVLLEASRRDHSSGYRNGQQPGPTATSRAMAIVHLAIHDTLAFVSDKPSAAYLNKKGMPFAGVPPVGAVPGDAVAGAASAALKALYPAYVDYFNDSVGTSMGLGFAFGEQVAAAVLAARAADGASASSPPPADMGYGSHRPDPYTPGQSLLGANWGSVTHFVGPRVPLDDFPGRARLGTSDLLNNAHYKRDFNEVKSFGARPRQDRTAEQSLIGVYWAYDGAQGIGVPPRLYNQIVRRIIAQLEASGTPLNQLRTAELFAKVNVAMADGGIDAWYHKYDQNLWRPVVGIRYESGPEGDSFWAPLGAPQTNQVSAPPRTPPFPAYPSGHATFGAALFQILRLSLQTGAALTTADVIQAGLQDTEVAGEPFALVSDELDGRAIDVDGSVRQRIERSCKSFARAVWENSISRVYLGVHWRFDGLPRDAADNIGGVPLGLKIGEQVHQWFESGASLGR
jgi:hypothetical protein